MFMVSSTVLNSLKNISFKQIKVFFELTDLMINSMLSLSKLSIFIINLHDFFVKLDFDTAHFLCRSSAFQNQIHQRFFWKQKEQIQPTPMKPIFDICTFIRFYDSLINCLEYIS